MLRSTDTIARLVTPPTLARLGGDEFTVLLDGVDSAADALAIADRLQSALTTPFRLQGREVFASISIGIVLSSDRYDRAEDLLRDADTAMYRAKADGKARSTIFDTSMRQQVEERLSLESDLRHALDRGELRLYYQPIVDLTDSRLTGFEALLRWHHPARGLVMPSQFVPIAEETGLIVPIGRWALDQACRQVRAWETEFGLADGLDINVNLSARQCFDPDLVSVVADVLAATGLPAERLHLEITESVLLHDTEAIGDVLARLRRLGVRLGLDDFGTGYSALSYLQQFPFQTIKIDRSFVEGLHESGNVEIIRAVVSLAMGLEMTVTAEGIETAEQLAGLRALACESGQGYYFDRPLSDEEAYRALLDGKWSAVAEPSRFAYKPVNLGRTDAWQGRIDTPPRLRS
jgi:predicted signal transduction protein with EAL and GGDEF domain